MSLATQHQRYTDTLGPIKGDCWRTAVACLLEVPRDDVPHFIQDYWDHENTSEWYLATQRFVEEHKPGWTLKPYGPSFPTYLDEGMPEYVILTGQSPRGDWLHCVVASASDGSLVWDPHPAGGGVLSQVEQSILVPKETP